MMAPGAWKRLAGFGLLLLAARLSGDHWFVRFVLMPFFFCTGVNLIEWGFRDFSGGLINYVRLRTKRGPR